MNEDIILAAALSGVLPQAGRATCSAYEDHVEKWLASHKSRGLLAAASATGDLELQVLDVIGIDWWTGGGITAQSVKAKLDAAPNAKTIRVLVDSPGGDAFMGIAIQALLKRHAAQVMVEVIGEASSAASIIAMAGDRILMHEGSMMMVHRAQGGRRGYATDLRAAADALDGLTTSAVDLYTRRTGKDRATVQSLVDAETWMTATQAVEKGFADEVLAGKAPEVAPAKTATTTTATTTTRAKNEAPPHRVQLHSRSLQERALAFKR